MVFSRVWGARGGRQGVGGSGHGRDGGNATSHTPSRPERTSSGWVGWGKEFFCVYGTEYEFEDAIHQSLGWGKGLRSENPWSSLLHLYLSE
jgi:hypothetical protein